MEQSLRVARINNTFLASYWDLLTEDVDPDPEQPKSLSSYVEGSFTEITPDNSPSEMKVFQSAELHPYYLNKKLTICNDNITLYDFYEHGLIQIISERARQVFEKLDPMSHQYYLINLFDNKGDVLNEQPYYIMFIRRFIELEDYHNKPPRLVNPVVPINVVDGEYFSAIVNSKELRLALSEQYCWRQPFSRSSIYMSQLLLKALRDAGCTGLDDETNTRNDRKGAPVIYV